MFNIEGVCDWCHKHSRLIRHNYIDGKCNYSCEECNLIAEIDVRLFNSEEPALTSKTESPVHS